MSEQLHFADTLAQYEPLRRAPAPIGFEHCPACHGWGIQYEPKRCCDECKGMGHVLLTEQRLAAERLQRLIDERRQSAELREWTKRHQAGKLGHMRRKQRSD